MVELQAQELSPDNPWPGLEPFDEADRKYFHGRAAESGELARLIRRELLTVLFGRSGLGKTSLLKAGLFPILREEDCLPVYLRLDHAEEAPPLGEQIFRELQTACDGGRVQAARPAAKESLWSFFHRRDAEFWSDRNRPVTPVIVLDQFEEIFTLGPETERSRVRSAAFLSELAELVENRPPDAVRETLEADPTAARRFDFKRSAVKLVLSFREDFLAQMEDLKKQMPSLMYNRFRLLPMNGAQAYEVIIRAGGRLVDDDVARRILRLAWKNEPEPPVDEKDFPRIEIDPALLSVVCSELNHKRLLETPPLERITIDLLKDADREILAGFYERSMEDIHPRVRALVEDKLITDRGYRDSFALEDALDRPGVTLKDLDALIRRRLLGVDERQHVRRLELTHDVLTRVVKESRDNRRAREAEQEALEQQRRYRRNAAILGAGGLVLIVLTVLAVWTAWRYWRLLRDWELSRLTTNAERLQDIHYDASLLVSLEMARIEPEVAESALLKAFASHPHLSAFLVGHQDAVWSVVFSPDGKRLASASLDKAVILWDATTRKPLARLEGRSGEVRGVAFSPDGRRLASAHGKGSVILWDVDSHERLAVLEGHREAVIDVAFSPDGRRLASASEDKTVILWDVDSQKQLATLEAHQGEVNAVAFSPDGVLLASASEDKNVILWDVDSRQPLKTLPGHGDTVFSVAFTPDGKQLASASRDKTVILWDVPSRKLLDRLQGHADVVFGVTFSPNGKQLASASKDKTVILWDIASRKRLATFQGHTAAVESVAFNPEGTLLASASDDHNLILWRMDAPETRDLKSLSAEACRTANRNLTCDEWWNYIGFDKPYHRTCEGLPAPEICE